MAITASAILEEGNAANWTDTFTTTATATPTGSREVLVFVTYQVFSGSAPSCTLSGQGITWAKVTETTVGTNRRGVLFRGSAATPSTGALTVTLDSGATCLRRTTHEIELGADASVNNIVQSVVASNDTAELTGGVTLAAFADATNNATFLFGWKEKWEEHAMAVDTPLTIVGTSVPTGTENSRSIVGFDVGEDTTPSFTWTTTSADWLAIGIEVDAAAGGTPATPTPAVIAVTTSLPTPTVLGGAIPTPAAIAATTTLPTPTVLGGAIASPATISATTILPAPTVFGGAIATPAAIAVTVTLPTPTAKGGAIPTPAVITVPVTLPAPAAQGGTIALPGVIAIPVTMPSATPRGGATATPDSILVVVALPTVVFEGLIDGVDDRPWEFFVFRRRGTTILFMCPSNKRTLRQTWNPNEGWVDVSERFRVNITIDRAEIGERVAPAWAAHAGSSDATLQAAIHSALTTAGVKRYDGQALS